MQKLLSNVYCLSLSDSNRVGLVFASVTKPSEVTLVSIFCSVDVNTLCEITKVYTWIDPRSVDTYLLLIIHACCLLVFFFFFFSHQ